MMQIFSNKGEFPEPFLPSLVPYSVSVMFLPLTVQFTWAGKAQEKHSPGLQSAELQTAQTTLGFSEQAQFSIPRLLCPQAQPLSLQGAFSTAIAFCWRITLEILSQAQKQSCSIHHEWILTAEEPPQFLSFEESRHSTKIATASSPGTWSHCHKGMDLQAVPWSAKAAETL